ncbi:hypothetical protein PVL29_026205 [Vitis rotundifolia]|uniref:Uncharacterized protein n=1 Tax=Vitis rotundifolia TaxID=103349 RepID=A0AA38YLV1_VITRO|nr:hypothetical protein PVL29_026205 [Vitis rotundifolia]
MLVSHFLQFGCLLLKKRTEEVEEKERKPNSSVSKPGEEPNLNFQLVPVKLPEVSDDGPSAK